MVRLGGLLIGVFNEEQVKQQGAGGQATTPRW
jgi:hypothetical protein